MPTLSATSLRTFWRPEEIFGRHSQLIWLTLRRTGPGVTIESKQRRTRKMILQLGSLGYRIELLNPQASQAQAQ